MNRIFRAEIYKLRHMPSFCYGIVAVIPAGILWAVIAGMDRETTMIELFSGMASFASFFLVADIVGYVTNDYEKGTIKAIISSGGSKNRIFFGRLLVSIFIAEIGFLLTLASAALYAKIAAQIPVSDWTTAQYISSTVIQMIFIALYAAVGYFVSIVVRKQSLAVIIALVVIHAEPLLVSYLGKILKMDLEIFDISNISQQMEALNITGNVLLGSGIFVLVTVFVCIVIGVQVFKRYDI